MERDLVLSLCRELPSSADDAPPEWLLLIPAGEIRGRDGRAYLNRDSAALADLGPVDLPIDWEHSTHLKAPKGDPAPAAGWVVELQATEAGVRGRVRWTEAGAASIRTREYRYYSPSYLLDAERNVVRLMSVGLTNQPNLDLPALNARGAELTQPTETAMDKAILDALGLAEGATPEQALVAINQLKTSLNSAQSAAQTPDLSRFAPRADLDAALNRAQAAEQQLHDQAQAARHAAIEALIAEGLNSARISPATVDYHRAQAQTEGGIERLTDYLAKAPAIAANAAGAQSGTPPEGELALNAAQAAIAKAFGHTAADLAKYGDR